MVIPLSPVLPDIFMNHIEGTIRSHHNTLKLLHWFTYEDDILASYDGTNRILNNFLNFTNSVHNNIIFTMEMIDNGSIDVLDLNISRINNRHNFSINHYNRRKTLQ